MKRIRSHALQVDNELQEVIIMATPVERQGGMRLNNAMKQQVIEKALLGAFSKRAADLLKEEQTLSQQFWLYLFGPAKLKAAMLLGEPFVYVDKDRYDRMAPDGTAMHFNVGGHSLTMRTHLPVPSSYSFGTKSTYNAIRDEALISRCRVWQDALSDLTREREKVHATLAGMLANISTYTSLEKNWPQGKKFYEHLPKAFPFRHQVPAVLIDELNASLGIG